MSICLLVRGIARIVVWACVIQVAIRLTNIVASGRRRGQWLSIAGQPSTGPIEWGLLARLLRLVLLLLLLVLLLLSLVGAIQSLVVLLAIGRPHCSFVSELLVGASHLGRFWLTFREQSLDIVLVWQLARSGL